MIIVEVPKIDEISAEDKSKRILGPISCTINPFFSIPTQEEIEKRIDKYLQEDIKTND